jgi:two-component system, LuxR family, sensor kinase FixL
MTERSTKPSEESNAALRQQMELAQEQLRKFALAIEKSTDSIMITTPDGVIEFANPAFCQASGYSPQELIGRTPCMLQSGLTSPATYQSLQQALTAGKTWHGEFINRHRNGCEYTDAAIISPLRQADGQITHYVSVQKNVTELKQANADLTLSENRVRLAQSVTGLGVYDRDLLNGTINWDERTREFFGVDANEKVTHALFLSAVHPEDRDSVQLAHDRALNPSGTGIYHAQYRIINLKDKCTHHIEADGKVFFEDGVPARLVGVVRDVTDRKRLELEIKSQRNAMRQLINQQIAAHTAAAIAHEINQPLASVSVYAETALRMLQEGHQMPGKLENTLKSIVDQAQRAGGTLHELLRFLHQSELAVEPIDLNEVVHDALIAAEENDCTPFKATVQVPPNLKPVLSNRLQLQKVLLNLLRNSAEAMSGSTSIKNEILIRIQTTPEGNMALTTIQDCGPGLGAELARKIFNPFFTTKDTGIGLGLVICRSLIEAQGGRLWVDEHADSGAVFHFTLPFAS